MVQLNAGAALSAETWGLTASSVRATPLPGWYEVTGQDLPSVMPRIQADPLVLQAAWSSPATALALPDDPSFIDGTLWGLNGANGINAPTAWDTTTGATQVVVGVVDTGIDYKHPDLYKNIWINQAEIPVAVKNAIQATANWDVDGDGLITFWDLNEPYNQGPGKAIDIDGDTRITGADIVFPPFSGGWSDGVDDDSDGYIDDLIGWNYIGNNNRPYDDHGHGTLVSGIIGAMGNNNLGVVGVNWRVQLLPMKFLDASGNGDDSNGAFGIAYAAQHGARVSNNSWATDQYSPIVADAVTFAGSLNHLVVAGVGNSARSNDITPMYPASLTHANVISVAASSSNGALAGFSNFGAASVDLAAPGDGIMTTFVGGNYLTESGTSLSTPYVAGSVGLILSYLPSLSALNIKDLILSRVTPRAAFVGLMTSGGELNLGAVFTQEAEIQLYDGTTSLFDNVSAVDFGATDMGVPVTKTLTVANIGLQLLTLGALAVPAGFTLVSGLTATALATGQSATFVVRLPATTQGTMSGVLTLASNDPNEPSFRLSLTGRVGNRAPVVAPIPNQTVSIALGDLVLPVQASDADGDPLTIAASAKTELYSLDQQYGLYAQVIYFVNSWGLQEKRLYGLGGAIFYILPNGDFYRQTPGSPGGTGTLLASLGPSVYENPSQLHNAQNNGGTATYSAGNVIVTPAVGYVGKLIVTVAASDGVAGAATSFSVTVTNAAPVVAAIANQSMITGSGSRSAPFSATDADGQTLTLSATAWAEPYSLDQQYGLYAKPTYFFNVWGRQEKRIFGANAATFFLLPNGELFRQTPGAPGGTGTLLATLGPSVYQNPSLLHNAPMIVGTAVIANGNVAVTPPAGFVGRLIVTVTASDGLLSASSKFTLTVTNTPPTIAPIYDQSIWTGEGSRSVPFRAGDADGQTLVYAAAVVTEAYGLDQLYGLYALSTSNFNFLGLQEKWLYGANGASFFILPDGRFYRHVSGAADGGALLTTLAPSYYQNPSLLSNATPTGGAGTATISGGRILVTPTPGFVGRFYVILSASDGFTSTSTMFLVIVTDEPPT